MSNPVHPSYNSPIVSIGVAVFNGEATLAVALESLISQTFIDFEIIISDNASTDDTADICKIYCQKDNRIRYVRQPVNLGATENFKFVLDQANGRYFMWAAADDTRSTDFLQVNVNYLEKHPQYIASTSPNCFEGQENKEKDRICFSIEGDSSEVRFQQFFENCWKSNAIFYSVMRTGPLQECKILGQSFLAADWAINLFLASRGKIYRHNKGLMTLGINGESNSPDAYRKFRKEPIELLLPFYRVSRYTLSLSREFSFAARFSLLITLLKLNLKAVVDQCHAKLYRLYCLHYKSKVNMNGLK